MFDRKKILWIAAVLFGLLTTQLPAVEKSRSASEKPRISENAETVKPAETPRYRVCVLDFSTPDILGQKKLLDGRNSTIEIPPQSTLNDADRKSLNSITQGLVRLLDAWDNTKTNAANRAAQAGDNAFNRQKALELYDITVKGEARPVILGAEYLAARLGRHNDVFSCIDAQSVTGAMSRLRQSPDFPKDFLRKLAQETGATHLIYGTVSDLRTKINSFKGYGIETKNVTWELDVIVRMFDLAARRSVYSNVYTGRHSEQHPAGGMTLDSSRFQTLMNSALEQAAEDLYQTCRNRGNKAVQVRPVTRMPSRGMNSARNTETECLIAGIQNAAGSDE